MTLQPGTRLGPYEVVAPIGAGGMGEVWRGRDTRLERQVAVKILPASLAHDPQFRARFEREAKTISQLNHPHICTLYDVGETVLSGAPAPSPASAAEGRGAPQSTVAYIVMELLEGELLADRLARGPLAMSDVLKYGGQIAEALDRAHHAGVVHRDLKPGNVMLTKSGAKLLDFGLAKGGESVGAGAPARSAAAEAAAATLHKPLTQEGTILGTFQYMAPEQLEGLEADARTDIFALGAVLYEMATGKRAFDGNTKTSLIAAIVSQDPKPISQLQPLTPPAFEHLVAKCLSKDADSRWQSAYDIAEELRWIGEAGSQAGVAAPLVARKRLRVRLAWSVAAALAVALAAVGWLYVRAEREASRTIVSDLMPPPGMRSNAVGDESGALVVSPDGTMAVYSVLNGSVSQLWLRSMATGETKLIAGTEGGTFPFWSPDSRKIGFFTLAELKSVDVAGGAPVTITTANGGPRGGSWGSAGWIVFTPDTQSPIYRVSVSGGTAAVVTKIDARIHTSHRWPSFLPDGKHFLFLAANHQNPTGGENGIYLGSVDGGPAKLVTHATSNGVFIDGRMLFARNQTLFAQRMTTDGVLRGEAVPIAENVLNDGGIWRGAFSVSDTGLLSYHTGQASMTSNLLWVDRSGKDVGQVGDKALYWDPELSPDGQKLAIPIGDPLREMWLQDLKRNTRTRLPLERSWTQTAVFSPDGSLLYIGVVRDGQGVILARRTTGGAESSIIQLKNDSVTPTSISPDGKTLLGYNNGGKILRVSVINHTAAPLTPGDKSTDLYPEYSPDGKWIAYMSDQNGRVEIFVIAAADPNQKWQISNSGGVLPRWRRDGKELFFMDLKNRINAVPIEASGSDLTVGAARPLFAFNPRPQCRAYDVSADGQRFLINAVAEQESLNVVLVTNWKSRLKP